MASRPTWKGQLRISLVTVPVKMFAACAAESTIRFNQLHRTCGARLQQKRWCPSCDTEADKLDITRGYEHEKGSYVTISDDELAAAQPDSTKVIDLDRFAAGDALDPMYIDRPYYLAPDGDPHGRTFKVIKEALRNRIAIGKLAMSGREHRVAVLDRGEGLVLFTLRRGNEIRSMRGVTELENVPEEVNEAEVELASRLMDTMEGEINFASFEDAYQERIRQVIDAKITGEAPTLNETPKSENVVDLMAALRKSLDATAEQKAS